MVAALELVPEERWLFSPLSLLFLVNQFLFTPDREETVKKYFVQVRLGEPSELIGVTPVTAIALDVVERLTLLCCVRSG